MATVVHEAFAAIFAAGSPNTRLATEVVSLTPLGREAFSVADNVFRLTGEVPISVTFSISLAEATNTGCLALVQDGPKPTTNGSHETITEDITVTVTAANKMQIFSMALDDATEVGRKITEEGSTTHLET